MRISQVKQVYSTERAPKAAQKQYSYIGLIVSNRVVTLSPSAHTLNQIDIANLVGGYEEKTHPLCIG